MLKLQQLSRLGKIMSTTSKQSIKSKLALIFAGATF
jgi:hypothetical protein